LLSVKKSFYYPREKGGRKRQPVHCFVGQTKREKKEISPILKGESLIALKKREFGLLW